MRKPLMSIAFMVALLGYVAVAYAGADWKAGNSWHNYSKNPKDADCSSCSVEYSHVLNMPPALSCGGTVLLDGIPLFSGNWWNSWQYQCTKSELATRGCLPGSYCAKCTTISPTCSATRFYAWCTW